MAGDQVVDRFSDPSSVKLALPSSSVAVAAAAGRLGYSWATFDRAVEICWPVGQLHPSH